ncbi:hypothetical protein [Nonomuraea rubra]|uniref:Uncharacterized protein n=1 Tax=Nonomuraea rubra TaxID=46180 RepID=A0A7X0P1D2_9ACTN|nr:hypothetical protein [Nonomuraea rubra]MBB6553387.1 hypothetical protein [Nonomuraea rubra]
MAVPGASLLRRTMDMTILGHALLDAAAEQWLFRARINRSRPAVHEVIARGANRPDLAAPAAPNGGRRCARSGVRSREW